MNIPSFPSDAGPSSGLPAALARDAQALSAEAPRAVGMPYGGYPDNEPDESEYRALFFKYLGLALKHRKLILGICGGALVLGLLVTFLTTPIYRATATIQINREAAKVVNIGNGGDDRDNNLGNDEQRFYQTEYDLLRSRSLASRVVAKLDLANAPGFLDRKSSSPWSRLWNTLFAGGGDDRSLHERQAAATTLIQQHLDINPVVNSRLVRLSYDSADPSWAAKIANGVAENFISDNLDRRYAASAYARNFLSDRLQETKQKLEDSERALVAYAQEKQIVTSGDSQPLTESDLVALNTALEKVRADRIRDQELWKQASTTNGLGLPQILSDPTIQTLRNQRAVLSAEYENKLHLFKPAYPDMRKLKAQIDQVDREIDQGIGAIKKALKARYDAEVAQEAMLEKHISETKQKVLTQRSKSIGYKILEREVETNRTLYNGLLQQYKDVGVAGAVGTNNISLVDTALPPKTPYKPSLIKNLLIFLVLGLIVSAIVVTVLEILDDTFKAPEEIESQLGLAVLGIIPVAEGAILPQVTEMPNSPVAEAYRSLRTALQFSTQRGAPKTLLVTSSRPGEGKSTTALALAVNFASLGMKTLLIDADLRNPSQHRLHGHDNQAGLAMYLAGARGIEGIISRTETVGLYLIPSGPLPPNPAELLAGSKMFSLLSAASEKFDAVIVDGPPVMGLADAPLLGSVTMGTLLVIAAGEVRRAIVKGALKRLHFARAHMVGAVLNKFDSQKVGYGYGYGYSYGYGELDYYGYGGKAVAQVEHAAGG